jgi:NAD(P)-dependent dehydrogenase (short-subunit alcohol dehydrogenase family)
MTARFDSLFSLRSRKALITGGTRGLGLAIARGFLEQGAQVTVCSRKRGSCDEAVAVLRPHGDCEAVVADVSTADGIRTLAERFAGGGLDIVVHSAGTAWAEDFDSFPAAGWDKVVDLNVKAPFFLTQALGPALRRPADAPPGKVIVLASIDGLTVNPQETYSYAASKAALIHLTRRLALRLADDNIVVNAIAPGMFPTDMNRRARDASHELTRHIPVRRLGADDDIAAAAVYLASSAGDYVVGETLVVDGGLRWVRPV